MKKLIQHIKNQISINDDKIELILGKFEEKHFDKKEYLLHSGTKSNYEFFITDGCVRTFITDSNGGEHNIFFSIENWWSGDLQSFINRIPAQYSIQAIEKTDALAISQENWKFLTIEVPEFLNYSRSLFRNTVMAQQNRIVQSLSFTAKERYSSFI